MAKKWIPAQKKGALHREMGIAQGKRIPSGALAKAAKKPGLEGERAREAETFRGFKKK